MRDAFAPVEALYRAQVMEATWGHLAPRKNKAYKGNITFAIGCYGDDPLNPTILQAEFGELPDSPWLFGALPWVCRAQDTEEAGVYRFDGTFKNYEFSGTVRKVFGA